MIRNLFDTDTRSGYQFSLFIFALIIISVIMFSIETLPNLSGPVKQFLYVSEIVITGIFTLEYILRISYAQKKREYIFSFYGIVDLLAILPFYLSFGVADARPIRILRLFRLFKIFELKLYSRAIMRLSKVFTETRYEIFIFIMVSMMLIYFAAVGVYYFEHTVQPEKFKSVFHSLWWAIATLTTVGYGDVYPITVGGRIFTFFVVMFGLAIIAVPSGIVAAALSKILREEKNN